MRRSIALRLATAIAVGAFVAAVPVATATNLSDITIVPVAGGGNLPAGGTADWTTLRGPIVEFAPYSNPDVLPEGTIVTLSLPDGFDWDTAALTLPTVAPSPGMPAGICELTAGPLQYAGSDLSFAVSGTHDIGCRIAFTTLRVRALGGTTPPGGDITATWTVPGLGSGSASAGSLAVAVAPDDTTPIVPATRETPLDLGPILLVVVIAAAIAVGIAFVWRRPASPAA